MDQHELLEVGAERPGNLRKRRALIGVAIVVVAAGVLLNHAVREREERAVARCADEVETAVDLAGGRVQATYEYVRPGLTDTASRRLENGLYKLIAESASNAEDRLLAAHDRCSDIDVFALHRQVDARRDRCLEVLAAQRAGLDAVARDGATVMEWLDTPRNC